MLNSPPASALTRFGESNWFNARPIGSCVVQSVLVIRGSPPVASPEL